MISTGVVLFLAGLVSGFVALVALNGVMDRRANTALILLAIFILGSWVLSSLLSGWWARLLQEKRQWKGGAAASVAVLASSALGVLLFFISIIAAILLAGIK